MPRDGRIECEILRRDVQRRAGRRAAAERARHRQGGRRGGGSGRRCRSGRRWAHVHGGRPRRGRCRPVRQTWPARSGSRGTGGDDKRERRSGCDQTQPRTVPARHGRPSRAPGPTWSRHIAARTKRATSPPAAGRPGGRCACAGPQRCGSGPPGRGVGIAGEGPDHVGQCGGTDPDLVTVAEEGREHRCARGADRAVCPRIGRVGRGDRERCPCRIAHASPDCHRCRQGGLR